MIAWRLKFIVLIAAFCVVHSVSAKEPIGIVVLTVRAQAVADPNSRASAHYYLDTPDALLEAFGRGLPLDPQAAYEDAMRRLNSTQWAPQFEAVRHGFEGLAFAWRHRITDLPAIVIDRQYLIYGVHDLEQALRIYRAHITSSERGGTR